MLNLVFTNSLSINIGSNEMPIHKKKADIRLKNPNKPDNQNFGSDQVNSLGHL